MILFVLVYNLNYAIDKITEDESFRKNELFIKFNPIKEEKEKRNDLI